MSNVGVVCNGKSCGTGKYIGGGRYICQHNNFKKMYPNLLIEWDYENNEKSPEEFTFNSSAKIWWICSNKDACFCHKWCTTINHRTSIKPRSCPYCNSGKPCVHNNFAVKFPNLLKQWDFEKNINSPESYASRSNERVYWQCEENQAHKWDAEIRDRTRPHRFGCPLCNGNKTEDLLLNLLKEKFASDIEHQSRFDWCKNPSTHKYLPFDFLIKSLKLIIELDGAQHFKQISNWASPEETRVRDKYKMRMAQENGYRVIRLLQEDVLYNKYDWKTKLLSTIEQYTTPQIHYLCINNEYDVLSTNR
jgi:very-short-patch-repair endonuclease